MTFSKYLIQYRLKKAKTLLENKDMKISFIAFEVGYNDVSHFIQSFKKSYILQVKIFIKLRPLLC